MSKPAKLAKVPLEEPIVRGETTISTLTLRKPQGGELRGFNFMSLTQLDVDTVIKLIPRINLEGVTEHEAAQMDAEDLLQCAVEIGSFFLTAEMKAANPGL